MNEKQLIIITKDSILTEYISWSKAIEKFKIDDETLEQIIEEGIEIKGFFVDEAID